MRGGIALGSNVGDRLTNLRRAFRALRQMHAGAAKDVLFSSVYETTPVDSAPGTACYLNAVVEIETDLLPMPLLRRLQQIERKMGRPSERPRNAPRTIDLDVLYLGNLVLNDPAITLPHPRFAQRGFVLVPLAEIVPDLVLPGQSKPVAQLLRVMQSSETICKLSEALHEG